MDSVVAVGFAANSSSFKVTVADAVYQNQSFASCFRAGGLQAPASQLLFQSLLRSAGCPRQIILDHFGSQKLEPETGYKSTGRKFVCVRSDRRQACEVHWPITSCSPAEPGSANRQAGSGVKFEGPDGILSVNF